MDSSAPNCRWPKGAPNLSNWPKRVSPQSCPSRSPIRPNPTPKSSNRANSKTFDSKFASSRYSKATGRFSRARSPRLTSTSRPSEGPVCQRWRCAWKRECDEKSRSQIVMPWRLNRPIGLALDSGLADRTNRAVEWKIQGLFSPLRSGLD